MKLSERRNNVLIILFVILLAFCPAPCSAVQMSDGSGAIPAIAGAFKIMNNPDAVGQDEKRLHTVLLVGLSCLLLFTIVFIVCILLYDRTLSRQKTIAFKNLHALLRYKDAFYELSEENVRLRARLNALSAPDAILPPDDGAGAGGDPDEQLFADIRHAILSEKLYLQPDLCRDDVVERVYVPKNKFGQLFKRYAGTTFNGYVNALRLKDAAYKLASCPMLTVEGIATECGFNSRQNFYRLFCDQFGMTPSEFRKAAIRKKKEE